MLDDKSIKSWASRRQESATKEENRRQDALDKTVTKLERMAFYNDAMMPPPLSLYIYMFYHILSGDFLRWGEKLCY